MKIGGITIEIGLPLLVTNQDTNDVSRCKVVDIDAQFVYIDLPIHLGTDFIKDYPNNTELTLNYVEKNVVFEFTSHIVKRTERTVPALVIALPDKDEIKRIQRREFVRVEAAIDVAVHCQASRFSPFTSVTKDISGGGASIILPPYVEIEKDQMIELYYVLKSDNSDYNYLQSEAKIVSVRNENNIRTMSVEFIQNDERVEQKIILFCFDKQREEKSIS